MIDSKRFDKAWLDRIAAGAVYYSDSHEALIELARLGLWARSHAIPRVQSCRDGWCGTEREKLEDALAALPATEREK